MGMVQAVQWQDTLAEVERAVGDCLAALDRYERAFDGVLHARGAALRTPPAEPLGGWEERLGVVRQNADAVEVLLDEQEAEWAAWMSKYDAWKRSVEQPPST